MGLILKPRVGLLPRWNNNPVAIPAPVGVWLMNEGSGSKAYDLSGNENAMVLSNGYSWIADDLVIDGSDGKGLISGANLNNLSNFTIVVSFLKHAYPTAEDSIFFKQNEIAITLDRIDDGGRLEIWLNDGGWSKAGDIINSAGLNVWWNIAVTFDGSNVYGYVDGFVTLGPAGDAKQNTTNDINVGYDLTTTEYFDGQIKYMYLYDRALTPAQIVYLYQHPYYAWKYPELWEMYAAAAVGAVAPTGVLYGPLFGPMAGPI